MKAQRKAVVESPKTEQKKIPQDVKKNIVLASSSATFRIPVLMYHYVEYVQDKKDTIRQALNVTPYAFEQQVKTLKENGFTFLTAQDVGNILDGKLTLPPKPVLLTFDDGHWDFDTNVLPILKKYNAHATAYIIPGFTGGSDFMSKTQLEDVIKSGLVDVGAHTIHHISLKRRLYPIALNEIFGSKKILEDTYHIHVVSFAYPNGAFDQQAVDIVRKSGFTTAVSTIPGEDVNQENRFFIFRLRPGYRTGQTLISYLTSNPWTPKISPKP